MHCEWGEGSPARVLCELERDMMLAKKKVRPLVVLTRTTFCRASAVRGSQMGQDSMVNSAPFDDVDRKYPPNLLNCGWRGGRD